MLNGAILATQRLDWLSNPYLLEIGNIKYICYDQERQTQRSKSRITRKKGDMLTPKAVNQAKL